MSRTWDDFTVTPDDSGRLYIARCGLCGSLIAASPDKLKAERLASNHHCELLLSPETG